ncbi:MAG: hypothetical protein JSR67_11780 [Proteobacteria bacterium]|nr:hypothetical protein [Pseudomonadota bacterium]
MRRSTWLVVVGAVLAVGAGQAALAQAAHENTQQSKMKTCNADPKAKELKGEERKAFMKECLSHESAAKPAKHMNSQQEKMKACNADAKGKGLKGAEHKAFVTNCLKGGSAEGAMAEPAGATKH